MRAQVNQRNRESSGCYFRGIMWGNVMRCLLVLQLVLSGNNDNNVCELCGHVGYGHLLVCCTDCKGSTTHQYCLEEVVYDARFVEFVCYECHQKHEELKHAPVEKEPGHAHSGSTVHHLNTKPLGPSMDAVKWRNTESRFVKYYYSRKKWSKKKPTMQPEGSNLANRETETTAYNRGGFTTKLFGGGAESNNMEIDLDLNLPVPSLLLSVFQP